MTDRALRWGVCVPTLNAGLKWSDWLTRTGAASISATRRLVIDSSSTDGTPTLAGKRGWEVLSIKRCEFDHGGTRQQALHHLSDCDIVVFLTQDALVADPQSLNRLVCTFNNPRVAAAFGRQLPHTDATPVAAHARYFNYPATSRTVSKADISCLGIKTAFLSNSFAAYRRETTLSVGGFPEGTILSEDMLAGARLLKAGWELAYEAHAQVFHSHNYSLFEEFRRYFDIGVLHHREAWLLEWLGKAEGEGGRFVISEVAYLLRHAPWRLPEAGIRTLLKYIGYRLGNIEDEMPVGMKRYFSMNKRFWN